MKEKNHLLSFFKYIKFATKEFVVGLIFVVIGISTEIVTVKIISNIFKDDLAKLDKNIVLAITFKLALIYLGIKMAEAFAIIMRKYLLVKGSNVIHYNIQKMVYDHVQALPIEYFDNIPAGSVLSRITSDVNQIRNFFRSTVIDSLVTIFKATILYAIMLYIDYRLALIFLIFVPFVFLLQTVNTKVEYPYLVKMRKENSLCSGIANEMCQNLEVIKAFNNEEKVLNNWQNHAKKKRKAQDMITYIESLSQHNAFDLLRIFVNLTIIFYFIYSNYNNLNLITVPNTLLFLFYSSYILNEVAVLTTNLSVYTRAKGAAKNLKDLLELKVEKKNGQEIIEDFKANIKFENVSFSYKEDNYVLKDINLEIKENETVAFVGHTGSGKSTIMNLLIKFYENQKGNIYISGKNLKDIENDFIRSKMAIVLQDSFLFEGTILSNISEDKAYSQKCLELVGAKYLLDERGIDANVLIDGSNFSTGEKQLISFARALASNPSILILDEATANVDSKTEQKIQKGIEVLSKNRTTLIIAHRLSTIKNADMIYVLDKGKIIEKGNHNELVNLNGIYKSMLDKDKNDKEKEF
ncbi:ABC transporter ATP-binding protein [Caviibacter abscessus]|uniref:ABC transporter ATP-binding protein n=1 Tax=Caviibacter abscessus TaxID=1766719 RepID=UPI000837CDDA|nr:ABC transporter ATP-binding protein [Caviibacter abscessus]